MSQNTAFKNFILYLLNSTLFLSFILLFSFLENEVKASEKAKNGKNSKTNTQSSSSGSANQNNELNDLKFVEGDEKGNEIRALKTEMLVSASEDRAIKQIQTLLKKYKGTPLEADLLFRLAEMHMRRAKSDIFFEVNRKSETVVTMAPQEVKHASSRKSIQQAVDIYETIQKKYKQYEQIDVVLFNNGFARQQLGQNKEAEQRYWFVIKTFPQSSLVPDCHLAIGEMAFEQQNFKHALDHFNAIKKYPDSRVYPYGLYKAGWTYYNLRNALAGLKELEKTVEYGKLVIKNNIDARLDLRREALSDMTLFYEEVYPADNAWKYFSAQAEGLEVGPYIMKLALLYKRHSRFADINVVLKDFIKNLPHSELRPEAENEMIMAYDNLKDYSSAVAALGSMFKICEPNGRWVSHEACAEKLPSTSLRLALKWYKSWRVTKSEGVLASSAEKAFSIHLQRAKKSEDTHNARFSYAELLFQMNKFREASFQYAKVGMESGQKEKTQEALYAALLSLEKAAGEKWSDEDEKQFGVLVKGYVERHPKGKVRLDIEFKMALIAYEKGKYNEAAPIFQRLGTDYSQEDKGRKAQDLYLDILNIQKNYPALKSYAFQLRHNEKTPERKIKLNKIYEQAYFMEVQTKEEKANLSEALLGYKAFAKDNPSSDLAEQAWWNSIQIHYKLSDLMGGAQAGEEFYRQFPKSKKSADALLRAAQTYEEMAQLEKAAKVLILLSQVDAASSLRWKSLAADYMSISGQQSSAIKIYEELRVAKDTKLAFHALEQLSLIAKERKEESAEKSWRKLIAHSGHEPQASLAQLKRLEEIYSQGQLAEAFADAKKIIGLGKEASQRALGRARFIQSEILAKEFYAQSVKSRAERITVVLGLKTEKLEKAQQAYQSAMKYGDPHVTVESLERMSDLYRHFVESLRNMPLPEGLEARDESVFREEMEKLAIPLEEKSVDSLAHSIESARKLELRDGTVARLQKKMNQMNMVKEELPKLEVYTPALLLPEVTREVGS